MTVSVPRTFGGLTGTVPLSYLDDNFTALVNGVNGIVANVNGLYQTGTTVSVTNTTSELPLFSYTVPGNTLGTHGMIRSTVMTRFINTTGGSVILTLRVKYGSTVLVTWVNTILNLASSAPADIWNIYLFANNATNAQKCFCSVNETLTTNPGAIIAPTNIYGGYNINSTEDSTIGQTLTLTAQWASASTSLTANLISATVESVFV